MDRFESLIGDIIQSHLHIYTQHLRAYSPLLFSYTTWSLFIRQKKTFVSLLFFLSSSFSFACLLAALGVQCSSSNRMSVYAAHWIESFMDENIEDRTWSWWWGINIKDTHTHANEMEKKNRWSTRKVNPRIRKDSQIILYEYIYIYTILIEDFNSYQMYTFTLLCIQWRATAHRFCDVNGKEERENRIVKCNTDNRNYWCANSEW